MEHKSCHLLEHMAQRSECLGATCLPRVWEEPVLLIGTYRAVKGEGYKMRTITEKLHQLNHLSPKSLHSRYATPYLYNPLEGQPGSH